MKNTSKCLMLMAVLLASTILLGADIPYLTGRVNDTAGLLSDETKRMLTEMLKAHEERTGNQIAVLTIPSLDGENIEDYAVRVFEAWKLGQNGVDNGLLILVVPNDRRMRIEVGYGLEGNLTDGTAGQIIRTIMTPHFKEGDFDEGISEGARAVIAVLESGELPASAVVSESGENDGFFEGPDLPLQTRILIGAFIFGIIGIFTFVGIVTPGMGWFLYFFLIPFWAMFPIVVIGVRGALVLLAIYIVGFPVAKLILRKTKWYKKAGKSLRSKGKATVGGFTFSTSSSGGSWSSGGSSFSGGGGSSGGGGASGSW